MQLLQQCLLQPQRPPVGSGEDAGYPTVCKGRYRVGESTYYAIEEPTSLNTLELLPELMATGAAAVKIEGRQRSPAYVGQVTRIWRQAIDACRARPEDFPACLFDLLRPSLPLAGGHRLPGRDRLLQAPHLDPR